MLFESTPDFLYPDFFEAGKFKLSKNLFRKVRTRDNINAIFNSATQVCQDIYSQSLPGSYRKGEA